jgi:hypothetical protein
VFISPKQRFPPEFALSCRAHDGFRSLPNAGFEGRWQLCAAGSHKTILLNSLAIDYKIVIRVQFFYQPG